MSKCNSITRIIPASFAWVILLFSTGIFFAFPCRYLMSVYSIAIPVFQSIVTFFVTVNFGLATFVNPGAIPKASSDEIKNEISSATYQDVEIRGVRVRLKWCVTCQFFRPPRCVHCGVCDTCIETFDHHCPWVNNCIGRRNYRYFFLFLVWLTIHMISILSLCALYMKDHLNDMKHLETIMTLSIIGIIILLFIPILGLTGFHIMLMTRGLTTNEQVTGKFLDIPSPYNKGCFKNILYGLCNSPLPRYHTKHSRKNYELKKYMKQPKPPEEMERNHFDKLQYQFVGKLAMKNECENPCGSSLLNRGNLHLSVSSSRALTPPVPMRLDYSRRSLPPHNKLHALNNYTVPESKGQFFGLVTHSTYAVGTSDTCCLGNQAVDKLQELANRSMMGGQCTDMTVLPKACSSFNTTPSKEIYDGQQLLTPQPLYLNNCDFLRTPGNRPLSFVKAMEMSDWNNEQFKTSHYSLEQSKQKNDHEISYEISV